MKEAFVYIIILLIPFIFEAKAHSASVNPARKSDMKAEEFDQEGSDKPAVARKLLYEKMAKRTGEYKDSFDGLLFTVNSYGSKALEAKDTKGYGEFILVAIDYNSVLGDLGLMQVILDMGKFVEEKRFIEYFVLMENGFERLKNSFSLKNELFLNRIAQLRNEDALRYEKALLKHYRDYFEYDLRLDKIIGDDTKLETKNPEKKR